MHVYPFLKCTLIDLFDKKKLTDFSGGNKSRSSLKSLSSSPARCAIYHDD